MGSGSSHDRHVPSSPGSSEGVQPPLDTPERGDAGRRRMTLPADGKSRATMPLTSATSSKFSSEIRHRGSLDGKSTWADQTFTDMCGQLSRTESSEAGCSLATVDPCGPCGEQTTCCTEPISSTEPQHSLGAVTPQPQSNDPHAMSTSTAPIPRTSLTLANDPTELTPRIAPRPMPHVGLTNFGNTCYSNAVIQMIYWCHPLRQSIVQFYKDHLQQAMPPPETSTAPVIASLGSKASNFFGFGNSSTPTSSDSTGSASDAHNVHTRLAELLQVMSDESEKTISRRHSNRIVQPKHFLQRVKRENVVFDNLQQQDAHEFAMFILNAVIDGEREVLMRLREVEQEKKSSGPTEESSALLGRRNDGVGIGAARDVGSSNSGNDSATPIVTPTQRLIEGQLVSEVFCMVCETRTFRYEPFIDLSLEVVPFTPLARCIERYERWEILRHGDKFYCEACCASVIARRRIRIHRLPKLLLVHLKRFKYSEYLQRFTKLAYHVPFPVVLKVQQAEGKAEANCEYPEPSSPSNAGTDSAAQQRLPRNDTASGASLATNVSSMSSTELQSAPSEVTRPSYGLCSVVVHQGVGINLGHYTCCAGYAHDSRSWRRLDDDAVHRISERDLQWYYGVPNVSPPENTTSTAYMLLYQQEPT